MEITLVLLLGLSLLGNLYLAWKLYLYVPPPPYVDKVTRPTGPVEAGPLRSTGISAFGLSPAGPFRENVLLKMGDERVDAMLLARGKKFEFITLVDLCPSDPNPTTKVRIVRKGLASTGKRKPPVEATQEKWEAFEVELRQIMEAVQRELKAKRDANG